jgi:hypothetical protein
MAILPRTNRGEGFDANKQFTAAQPPLILEPARAAGRECVSYKRFFTESAAS